MLTIPGSSLNRKPTGIASLNRPKVPTTVMNLSGSPRLPDIGSVRETKAASAPTNPASSSATAVNTSGRAPSATSVATRLNAACSAAN